eukprot:GHVP01061964.1.p1 GENE.GHVP01061964.1~~GHVP01061964.1.p1  ORF type:complete len:1123 (+),score=220.05 GHVP01061964.1:33-3371(+)
MNPTEEAKPTKRRDELREIELTVQKLWEGKKAFEVDAPTNFESKEKYFCTFPYPYMNGKIHCGHAFTFTKAEFAARFQRMLGKKVLWPFAFHCTGMPIPASADKLRHELEGTTLKKEETSVTPEQDKDLSKFSSSKTKLVAKTGNVKSQYELIQSLGVADEDIPKFVETSHWLRHFPPLWKQTLELFGSAIDWRRSFVTTDVNPYYDKFVRWQFNLLKKKGYISFGLRPAIFSPLHHQPVADHDRASGEGSGPQEYTLIKMEVLEKTSWCPSMGRTFLVAATLRPETMYGQTNCFVLPDGDYGVYLAFNSPILHVSDAVEMQRDGGSELPQINGVVCVALRKSYALEKCSTYYICSARSALNMAYQGLVPMVLQNDGTMGPMLMKEVKGDELIGCALKAPLSTFDRVYALPMTSISMEKGTGVVTSVPSDAPDDYVSLTELKKPKFMTQYNLKPEWIEPYDVVEIIEIPGMGKRAAVDVCESMNILSSKDKDKLTKAKEQVYKKGFYEGRLIVGEFAGSLVSEAKTKVQKKLIDLGDACLYSEPEHRVVARSGEICIVASCEQWYLDYGREDWKATVMNYVQGPNFTATTEGCHSMFVGAIDWLKSHACSRQYGLGTRMPWDENQLIESLSDSTIYMSYYTISHLLQGDNFGKQPGKLGIKIQDVDDSMFDFVFGISTKFEDKATCTTEKLNIMKNEFEYWYPLDLRVSGKDLIFNHLSYSLYNHAAVWDNEPETRWPKQFFCNGHLMVNAAKMSKQAGNFLTLEDSIEQYGVDATRITLADGGDGLDDANFQTDIANGAIMRLYSLKHNFLAENTKRDKCRSGEVLWADRACVNEVKLLAEDAKVAYEKMEFKEALKLCFFQMQNIRDDYIQLLAGKEIHVKFSDVFCDTQCKILNPIAPHLTQYLWSDILGNSVEKHGLLADQAWPSWVGEDQPSSQLHHEYIYLQKSIDELRRLKTMKEKKKGKKSTENPSTKIVLYVATEFPVGHQKVLEALRSINFDLTNKPEDPRYIDSVKKHLESIEWPKNELKDLLAFARFHVENEVSLRGPKDALSLKMAFNEEDFWNQQLEYLVYTMKLESCEVRKATDPHPDDKSEKCSSAFPSKIGVWFS